MRVVHAVWTDDRLHLWSERAPTKPTCLPDRQADQAAGPDTGQRQAGGWRPEAGGPDTAQRPAPAVETRAHPFALDSSDVRALLRGAGSLEGVELSDGQVELRLPTRSGRPIPSPHIAHAAGLEADDAGAELACWRTPTVAMSAGEALVALEELENADNLTLAESTRFFIVVGRCARKLVAEQRFVPNILEDRSGQIAGVWRPWLVDEATMQTLGELVGSMPAAARAVRDGFAHDGWRLVHDYLGAVVDALCRDALRAQNMIEALDGRAAADDAHVAWVSGLLDRSARIRVGSSMRAILVRGVRQWLSRLDERGADSQWRLGLRLVEPALNSSIPQFGAPGRDVRWGLVFELQSLEHPETAVEAGALWEGPADAAQVGGLHIESPHDLLLAELARAARLYPLIERALRDPTPSELLLTTSQAYDFLREIRPVLIEQGFAVYTPEWWNAPSARLGVSLELLSEERPMRAAMTESVGSCEQTRLGLEALVDYRWRLSLGDTPLSADQFEELTGLGAPLVRISGKWVELRPDDVLAARRFLSDNPGGSTTLGAALQLAFGVEPDEAGLHVRGVHAQGWAKSLFDQRGMGSRIESIPQPEGFVGQLRPYQLTGLAWLMFLDKLGLGACLADDMGLGKTIQLLALLLAEREAADPEVRHALGPTLVIAPLSVMSNWRLEAGRFAPSLRVKVHHGPERVVGEALAAEMAGADMVITTYALAQRDVKSLATVAWRRVVLDEAQNIKNPAAKQTRAILNLPAPRRVALTGTPVENRLSELWSIMNFCNAGHLGSLGAFRRRFSTPIERRRSRARADQLQCLTRPFILRRLKSDPAIAADLPEKIENKVFSYLTAEQATLYEQSIEGMLTEVDRAEGMRRRGVVLATLIKLKQICNHPAQALGEPAGVVSATDPRRSGKCLRLIEMLDVVLSEGQQALIFTQFRQMGTLLAAMLRRDLDREILFLHGGTPAKGRQRMIERFQLNDGSAPIFVLSLKAGGFGVNLTAASHVFHFDRWWNPAVENQATDRAHRIGQTRTVHVHKFVVSGTLEDRIDQMIEDKSDLASRIISSGERGLTELSTSQLRELLTLRSDALGEEQAELAAPVSVEEGL